LSLEGALAIVATIAGIIWLIRHGSVGAPHRRTAAYWVTTRAAPGSASLGGAGRTTPSIPPTSLGFETHISQTSGRRYYRNGAPDFLPGLPALRVGSGLYGFEIHGESYHTDAIRAVVGGPYDAPFYFRTVAAVARERGNPYDPNAVAVSLGGRLVGYVPREKARSFGKELDALGIDTSAQCRAEVAGNVAGLGGWMYSIRLDIARPLRLSVPT
jgi:hypothetical protein